MLLHGLFIPCIHLSQDSSYYFILFISLHAMACLWHAYASHASHEKDMASALS